MDGVEPENNTLPRWHIPTEAEWDTLAVFLGGRDVAGGKLKEAGTTHWQNSNGVCSIKCVKVKSIKLNNFDHHGKTTIEKERKENAFGRNNS
ncbi:MAG: hypothetical protein NT040_19790 [Bacteroidetes bacterium]|nr:hypothetical protein [Bacteroidota bacterium]